MNKSKIFCIVILLAVFYLFLPQIYRSYVKINKLNNEKKMILEKIQLEKNIMHGGFMTCWAMYGSYVRIFIILIVCMAAIPSTGKRIPAIYQPILVYQSPPSVEECFLSYLIMRKRYLVKDIMLIQEEPVPD